mmetsp:Transcript_37699/g.95310  ORF Transcript_37699/g.95310 Transcript_37699/m.95310 type:complete len:322 (-) Transcript_37699:1267-2232(-)
MDALPPGRPLRSPQWPTRSEGRKWPGHVWPQPLKGWKRSFSNISSSTLSGSSCSSRALTMLAGMDSMLGARRTVAAASLAAATMAVSRFIASISLTMADSGYLAPYTTCDAARGGGLGAAATAAAPVDGAPPPLVPALLPSTCWAGMVAALGGTLLPMDTVSSSPPSCFSSPSSVESSLGVAPLAAPPAAELADPACSPNVCLKLPSHDDAASGGLPTNEPAAVGLVTPDLGPPPIAVISSPGPPTPNSLTTGLAARPERTAPSDGADADDLVAPDGGLPPLPGLTLLGEVVEEAGAEVGGAAAAAAAVPAPAAAPPSVLA